MLTPQHTLGHPGGAAGVEDVEIVAAGGGHSSGGFGCGGDGFVIDRAVQQRIAGIIGDLDEHLKIGQPVPDRGHLRGELRGVDQGLGSRVAQQVEQLLLDVAVIDVERRNPGAVAGHHGLEVLVTVAKI